MYLTESNLWLGEITEDKIRDILSYYRDDISKWIGRSYKKYKKYISKDDVENEVILGVVKAIKRYSPDRGVVFPAFAQKFAMGSVVDYIRQMDIFPRNAKRSFSVVQFPKSISEDGSEKDIDFEGSEISETEHQCNGLWETIKEILGSESKEWYILWSYHVGGKLLKDISDDLGIFPSEISKIRAGAINALKNSGKFKGFLSQSPRKKKFTTEDVDEVLLSLFVKGRKSTGMELIAAKRQQDDRTDEDIFESFQNGNAEDGLLAISSKYHHIFSWVNKRLRNIYDTEDVLQSTIYKILLHKDRFTPGKSKFKSWMWKIASNEMKTLFSRRFNGRIGGSYDMDTLPSVRNDECRPSTVNIKTQTMKMVMSLLSPQQITVLNLVYVKGMTQVAAMSEMKLSGVRTVQLYIENAKTKAKEYWDLISKSVTEEEIMRGDAIEFLSPNEASAVSGIHGEIIRKDIHSGKIKAVRLGSKLWKIRKEWLKEYKDGYKFKSSKHD